MKVSFPLSLALFFIAAAALQPIVASLPSDVRRKNFSTATAMDSFHSSVGITVVNGQDAARGEFPFYATTTTSLAKNEFCGGALIARNVILSAAHCWPVFLLNSHWVVGSTDDVSNPSVPDKDYQEKIPQKSFHLHPLFEEGKDPFFLTYDFAIIVLQREITNDNVGIIEPVDSDYIHDINGLQFAIMGRGRIENPPPVLPDVMQKATILGVNEVDCGNCYDTLDPEASICAGGSGVGICRGDSGGALVDDDGRVAGISSFGKVNCNEGFATCPSGFARVSAGWEWIREQVCKRAITKPEWASCG